MYPYFRFNEQERDDFDHDGLVHFAHDEELTSRQQAAAHKAHDRIYGKPADCNHCCETSLRRLGHWFEKKSSYK